MALRKTIFGRFKCNFTGMGYDVALEEVLKRGCELRFKLPTQPQRLILNQFILDLKSNNLWNNQDYILNFAYNDITLKNFSLINLKNPKSVLAEVIGGMTYTVNGFKGNGTDASVLTSYNPSTIGINYTLNNAGRGAVVYVDGAVTEVNRLIDYNVTGFSRMTNRSATQHRINSGATSLPSNVNLAGIGYKGIFRDSSTNVELYNKNIQSVRVSNSVSIDNGVFRLFSTNTGAWGDIGISFYHVGGYLTNTQVQTFRTIYNNYLTSLSLIAIT